VSGDPRVGLGIEDRRLPVDRVVEPQAQPEQQNRDQRGEPEPASVARREAAQPTPVPLVRPSWHPQDSTKLRGSCES
jgi:hypothetical protein